MMMKNRYKQNKSVNILNISNLITIFRVLLILPIILSLMQDYYLFSFLFFTIAGVSDILDGYFARRFSLVTRFGKALDPVADKILRTSVLIIFFLNGWISLFIFATLILLDLFLVVSSIVLYNKNYVIYSNFFGKSAAIIIYIAMSLKFLNLIFTNVEIFKYYNLIFYIGIFSVFLSVIVYLFRFIYQKEKLLN